MKKLVVLALLVASCVSLSACSGIRGYEGKTKVCHNHTFMGISIIEMVAPCK